MAAEQKASSEEKSMEEILTSIREIISGDSPQNPGKDTMAEKKEAGKSKKEEKPKEEEVLELTEKVEEPEAPAAAEPAAQAEEPAAGDPGDVLSNIDAALGAETATAGSTADDGPPPIKPKESAPAPAKSAAPKAAPSASAPSSSADQLLSAQTAEATASALNNLVKNIPEPKIESPTMRSGNTVEDLVIEALRPMLSEWLDKNLPTIVQKIVEKEIRKLLPRE